MFHPNTKKRISVSKGAKFDDKRPELASKLPKKGDAFENFKGGIIRLCDDMMARDISEECRAKVARIRSRAVVEL